MKKGTVSETVARPTRTVVQGGFGWIVTEGIDAFIYDLSDRQYGIAVIFLTAVFSFVQNALESGYGKAIFRDASKTDVPITDSTPNK